MQLFKKILPYSIFLALLVTVFNFQFCKQVKTGSDAGTFTVVVEGKQYVAIDKDLPDLAATERSPADVAAASKYLLNVATAANITAKIAEAVKGKKKTLPAVWALIPILIDGLPDLIKAGQSLKAFQAFYVAANGLTADERAQVANIFATELALPYPIAEAISEATIEAALANMKLASVIQTSVKK